MVRLSISITGVGASSNLPLKLAFVNSALQTGTRSLLDSAIVDYVRETILESEDEGGAAEEYLNLNKWAKVSEVPFDSSRRLLSVLVSREPAGTDEKGLFITKGAVEEVLDRCIQVYDYPPSSSSGTWEQFKPSHSPPLTVDAKREILETAERLNEEGLRLVAVACRSTVAMQFMTSTAGDERDLVFIGFLGFLDPVKPDAAEAINTLASLGVQVGHRPWSSCVIILSTTDSRFGFSPVTPQPSLQKLLELSAFFPQRRLLPLPVTSVFPLKLESLRTNCFSLDHSSPHSPMTRLPITKPSSAAWFTLNSPLIRNLRLSGYYVEGVAEGVWRSWVTELTTL